MLHDNRFGCHPLLPLYNVLSTLWFLLSPKLTSSPDYYLYVRYINFIEKMFEVLNSDKYISSNDTITILQTYIISKGITTLLFCTHNYSDLLDTICGVLNLSLSDYSLFSLLNSGITTKFCGSVDLTDLDQVYAQSYLSNDGFKNFITNEVNMVEVLNDASTDAIQDDINSDSITDEIISIRLENMSKRIFDLITKISGIIVKDREVVPIQPLQEISDISTPTSSTDLSPPLSTDLSSLTQVSPVEVESPAEESPAEVIPAEVSPAWDGQIEESSYNSSPTKSRPSRISGSISSSRSPAFSAITKIERTRGGTGRKTTYKRNRYGKKPKHTQKKKSTYKKNNKKTTKHRIKKRRTFKRTT